MLISGIQALVRLPLDQIRRDQRSVSGPPGSFPAIGARRSAATTSNSPVPNRCWTRIAFTWNQGSTRIWPRPRSGEASRLNLHPGAKVDGVFGLWYGKAPGVDRSGDVFKHANMTGTWHRGGVLAIAGDDPLAKSSTLPCQSEFAFVDAEIPILTPADIQDVLDLGLHGIALSSHSGLWAGMVALARHHGWQRDHQDRS